MSENAENTCIQHKTAICNDALARKKNEVRPGDSGGGGILNMIKHRRQQIL